MDYGRFPDVCYCDRMTGPGSLAEGQEFFRTRAKPTLMPRPVPRKLPTRYATINEHGSACERE